MFELKDGTVTSDIRLDRVKEFDPRSRKYSIGDAVPKEPRSYTWSCNTDLDQKGEGACVGFCIGNELKARPAKVQGITNGFCRELYYDAQRSDPWPGGEYPWAWPRYAGTSTLAGIKQGQKRGYYDEYRWAFTLEDFFYGIGHNGPAVIGVNWYEGMHTPDANGFIRPTGDVLGGHCTLVTAIDIKRGIVTIQNSWGINWGIHGKCFMTFEDIANLLLEDGEAAFLMHRHTVPQPTR